MFLASLDCPNFGGGVYRHMPAVSEEAKADAASEAQPISKPDINSPKVEKADVLVAGSLAIDLSCDYAPPEGAKSTSPELQTSNPAAIKQSLGGVGHNVAIVANRVGSAVLFCSVLGDDLSGRAALSALEKEGLSTDGIQTLPSSSGMRTAQYIAVNDAHKDLLVAMADMGIMELPVGQLNFDTSWESMIARTKPAWIVLDANWTPQVLSKWISLAKEHNARVAFEPVSTAKCQRLFTAIQQQQQSTSERPIVPTNAISLAAPNKQELSTMYTTARETGLFDTDAWFRVIDALALGTSSSSRDRLVHLTTGILVDQGIPQQTISLLPYIPCIVTKLGAQGVLFTQLLRPGDPRLTDDTAAPYILSRGEPGSEVIGGVYMRLFEPRTVLGEGNVVSVNAAGDTLLGVIVAGLARGKLVEDVVPVAQEGSLRTLRWEGGVSEELSGLLRD